MDPLSFSASIAGVISLADSVFTRVHKYIRAVNSAKQDIQALSEEVNWLAAVLRSLQALATELEAEGDRFDPTLRIQLVGNCKQTLEKIETRVKKAADRLSCRTASKVTGIMQQLKWPFSASETKELLEEVSRHKATMTAALSADTMRKLQLCLTKADDIGQNITAISQAVKEIKINTQIAVDDQNRKILDFFMNVSPQRNFEMSVLLRYPMTGLWLTESAGFCQWLETPGSKIWLSGIPGAGKTVLAGSVVQEALTRSCNTPRVGAAFFFCDYKDPRSQESVNILGAIASQLARQEDKAFDILQEYYDELHPARGLDKGLDPEEARAKITKMCELFDQVIIVVDGLDECGDNTDRVVEVLVELAQYSTTISIALFSRDHYDIGIQLQDEFQHIIVAAHTEDIELFVRAEMDKRVRERRLERTSIDFKDEIVQTLVKRSQGM